MDKTTLSLAWTPALNGIRSRAWWLDSYSLAYTVSSLLNQLFGKGQRTLLAASLYQSGALDHRALPRVPGSLGDACNRSTAAPSTRKLFEAKIEEAKKLSDDLNTGTVFVKEDVLEVQYMNLVDWKWKVAAEGQQQQTIYTRPLREKLDELQHPRMRSFGNPDPGEDTRERVEAVNRWFVPRLAKPRQQDQVFDCGGGLSVPCHVRHAGRGKGVLSRRAAYL